MNEGEDKTADNTVYCSFVSIHYIICECGETFPTEDALKEHLETEHPHRVEKKEYKCGLCNKVYDSEQACIQHHQKTHTVKIIKPPSPPPMKYIIQPIQRDDKDYVKSLIVTSGKHPPKKEKRKYVSREKGYNRNLKDKVCEVCGKKYASNAALRYHQRVHTGERPYRCSYCPKAFTMPLFLQIHHRIHTGERPYKCPHCPKAFGNKAALSRHDRVHTGVKPYACPTCHKTFTQSNSMKLHVHTVHLKLPAPYKSKRRRERALLKLEPPDGCELETELDACDDQRVFYNTDGDAPAPLHSRRRRERVQLKQELDCFVVKTEVDAPQDQDVFYDSAGDPPVLLEMLYPQD